ncbi:unnamed protein product [Didymodactylos carnosus]|uniref:C3H1-type domain-containing protein n=1 Tax=Didymodactylos carnosus TaxID=1234261 RepID=A0A813V6C0_9BILA|nr:unnamed protein product [Didymodactylos carnosus]CAF0832219.1 unnamed protein product [Didymodactylos carnosus]CAF3584902.1 unnamed protein product [Didymodactylos carnosus]CAF3619313.1 unnamed protein product [Didymodactylos carnosus]
MLVDIMEKSELETDDNCKQSKTVLPAKLRMKERSRSNTTDINDPENLDYEEEYSGTNNNNSNQEEVNKNLSGVAMDTDNLLLANDEMTGEEIEETSNILHEEENTDIAKDAVKTKKKLKEKSQSSTKKNHKTSKVIDKSNDEKIDHDDESKQDEEGELNSNHEDSSHDLAMGSDEGELDEGELEDGEIHETSTKKQHQPQTQHRRHLPAIRPSPIQHSLLHQREQQQPLANNNSISHIPLSSQQQKVHCRFFLQGRCHWGANCKYMHPNLNDTKNQSSYLEQSRNTNSPPSSAGTTWLSPQSAATAFFGNSSIVRNVAAIAAAAVASQQQASAAPATTSNTESAWERGLRSAKTLREQSMRRKQQDKDFNDKKFNLTLKDADEEKDPDEELVNIERPQVDYDDIMYHNNFEERWPMQQHSNPYNYHNPGTHIPPRLRHFDRDQLDRSGGSNFINYNQDRRIRQRDPYIDNKGDRKEKLKNSKSLQKSKDPSKKIHHTSQFPVPLSHHVPHQRYLDDEHQPQQLSSMARRADDWVDPWDRSRNNRRNTSRGRENSYTSSSGSSSRSSRPRRRSPSVTRSKPARQENVKNGEKQSSTLNIPSISVPPDGENQNVGKKQQTSSIVAPTERHKTTSNHHSSNGGNHSTSQQLGKKVSPNESRSTKFLPGRTISSHTLKKAEKAERPKSNYRHLNPQIYHQSQKEQLLNKDGNNEKKTIKKEGKRSDSSSSGTSSSSSASSSRVRPKAVSSTSSSRSSSSESEEKVKNRLAKENTMHSNKSVNTHTKPTMNRQVSSSGNRIKTSEKKESTSLGHTKSITSSRSGIINKDTINPKSSTSHNDKKRRDTSSSGSTTTKKLKTANHAINERKRTSPQPPPPPSTSISTSDSHKQSAHHHHKISNNTATDSTSMDSDSGKKKQKQKILKKLEEVEKLISQRTTKT